MNCELPDEDISRPRFAVNSLVEVFSSNFLSSTAGNLKTIKWKVVVILPSISPGIQTPAVIGWLTQAHQKSTRKLNKEACWLTYTHRPVDNILSSMPPVKRMYLHTANHTRKQTTSCPYLYTHYLSPLKCPLLFHAVILTGVASFQVITRKKSQTKLLSLVASWTRCLRSLHTGRTAHARVLVNKGPALPCVLACRPWNYPHVLDYLHYNSNTLPRVGHLSVETRRINNCFNWLCFPCPVQPQSHPPYKSQDSQLFQFVSWLSAHTPSIIFSHNPPEAPRRQQLFHYPAVCGCGA